MTKQTFNPKTHTNVEGKNILFRKPEVGDIVNAFSKNRVAVVIEDCTGNGSPFKPYEVLFLDTGYTGIVHQNEMTVFAKRNDNYVRCELAEINVKNNAEIIAEQYQLLI